MNYLSSGDWVIIVSYLIGIIGFGVWMGRGQRDTRDYFLGGRSIPWWGVSFSIIATETSALTFLSVPAVAFGGNLSFIQIIIGYVIARIVLAVVMVPLYFRGEIYSPYELLAQAFGQPARQTAAGFFLIAGTLAAGVRVYVTCIPIQLMFGLSDQQIVLAILFFVGLSLIYTYIGGVKAVIWTDAIQFFLFVIGGLYVLFFIPTLLDGGFSGATKLASNEGKLAWFNGEFALKMPYNIWMGVIGATFQVFFSHGVDQLVVQRVLTCKSVSDGRKALMLSAFIILPMMLLFLLIGVLLWAYYQANPDMPIAIPEARPGVGKSDYIFPIFILTVIPTFLKGFLIVGIISAAMSSVSSALSALASVSTMDFYKRWTQHDRDESFYLRFSKQSTLVWAGALVLVALWTQNQASVLNAAFSLAGLTSGPMLGGILLAIGWRTGRSLPVVVGMVSGLVGMILIKTFLTETVAWPWYTLIGTLITLFVALGMGRLVRA